MRHGEAGSADSRRWPDDRQRPLTEAGRVSHRGVARALRRMGVTFDRLLTSPLVRARQTADVTKDAYGWAGAIEETEALGDRAGLTDILAELTAFPRDAAVLCVGHEPHLSGLAAALISADGSARIELRKSGIIALDFEGYPAPARGTLGFHVRPEHLIALSEGA